MTSEFDDETTHTGAQEARAWIVRLASGEMTEEEWVRFRLWLNAHPRHLNLFKREREFWNNLEPLKEIFKNLEEDYAALPPDFMQELSSLSGPSLDRHASPVCRMTRTLKNSAAGLLAAGLVFFVIWAQWGWLGFADHRTGTGEQKQVVLPDGSTAHLNTASAINIQYDPHARRIDLLKGEAFFKVKPDSQKPFRVSTDTGIVEAVGTSFAVHRNSPGFTVTVMTGKVEVRTESEPEYSNPIRLHSGQRIDYTPDSPTHQIHAVNKNTDLSWRQGKIIIDGLPLVEAIAQLDRYRPGHTLMFGEFANGQPVSGVFNIEQADSAISALASTQGLSVFRLTDYLLIIR